MLNDIKKCNRESTKVVHTIKPSTTENSQYYSSAQTNFQINSLIQEVKELKNELREVQGRNYMLVNERNKQTKPNNEMSRLSNMDS